MWCLPRRSEGGAGWALDPAMTGNLQAEEVGICRQRSKQLRPLVTIVMATTNASWCSDYRMKQKSSRQFAREMRRRMNKAEAYLWLGLRRRQLCNLAFRRQYPLGPYFLDFACPELKLAIEVDGASHWTDDARKFDVARGKHVARAGWRELRVTNEDVYLRMEGVLDAVVDVANELLRLQHLRCAATSSLGEEDGTAQTKTAAEGPQFCIDSGTGRLAVSRPRPSCCGGSWSRPRRQNH